VRLLPRLADEEELDRIEPAPRLVDAPRPLPAPLRLLAAVVATSLVVRLGYLFFFADPENAGDGFTDAYHHWQIAYLTGTVGLTHGPRLWDMRGWEWFWGPLHPLLMNVMFFATGSTDIVLARLLSALFGTTTAALIFLLCHRYWGSGVAVIAGAFAALNPAGVFNDTGGMAEPVATALVLFGIWLTPRRGFFGGLAWAVAAMARVEAWLFGAGLVIAWLAGGRRSATSRAPLVIGWAIGMAAYAKLLLDQTGNPIYPLYVNFQYVGLSAGGTGGQSGGPFGLWMLLFAASAACAVGVGWSVWKAPPSYLLLTFGFGYSALSLATYLRYVTEWKERRFEFPLDFAAILLAVALVRWGPSVRFAWSAAVPALAAIQLLWIPVQTAYTSTEPLFGYDVTLAHEIGAVYNQPQYRGGVLNMPGDEPTLLYLMVRDEGLQGENVTSQFYDPFYYLPAGYHYADHAAVVGPLLLCWLSETRTRLFLISPPGPLSASNDDYRAYFADHPDWFADTGANLPNGWSLIAVTAPSMSSAECVAARSARH
jgi:hypothetical protein